MRSRFAWTAGCLAVWAVGGCRPAGEAAPADAVVMSSAAPAGSAPVPASPVVDAGARWDPATTRGVIAGVLSWQDPGLTPFSAHHRKDEELHRALVGRGVPAKALTLLLDATATRATIEASLERAVADAPPGSTLVFYYAGHGVKDDAGRIYFASYDMQGGAATTTGLSLARVEQIIATGFRGGRVILMADCCYSGGLATVAESLSKKGIDAVSLTSAEDSNLSTANWTFSQTVLDAIAGDPLADRDGNGAITLAEMGTEVADAMKYREKQRSGFFATASGGLVEMARASGATPAGPAPFAPGTYAETKRMGDAPTVRVLHVQGSRARVRAYHYADADDFDVEIGALSPLRFDRYPVGEDLRVWWGGKLWDARVTATDGDFHRITYPGWPAYWDEWVMSDRIATKTK